MESLLGEGKKKKKNLAELKVYREEKKNPAPGWARTSNLSVNSRTR